MPPQMPPRRMPPQQMPPRQMPMPQQQYPQNATSSAIPGLTRQPGLQGPAEEPPEDADLLSRIMEYLSSLPDRTIEWAKKNIRAMNKSQDLQLQELEEYPPAKPNDEVSRYLKMQGQGGNRPV